MATKRKRRSAPRKTTHRRRRSSVSGVTHRRRRRTSSGVGKIHSMDIMDLAAAVGGAVVGRIATTKLKDKVNPKILAGVQIAAGFVVPQMTKNKMIIAASKGLFINGSLSILNQTGVMAGIAGMVGADNDLQLEYLSGTDELNSIAGEDDEMGRMEDKGVFSGSEDKLSILAGIDDFEEQLSGMDDDDSNMGGMDDDY